MDEFDSRDFLIVNEYGLIGVALSLLCFIIILEFMKKDEKINWKNVLINTAGMTITIYLFNAVIVLFKAIF
ncbi:hypothetical protein QPK24_13320 [Paenibacillus polygoni]|uniref:Uncharacterized protein n=1 Tax=Paenibacillus polygoni TaxID=3050112 RepID=A0ABY8X2E4_9BACL|nr:hypothetical protein [Paenibacillus polygoni]WIV17410.1 hypothetical protein QPK24_13320 [Paenibacillus polygoni]